MRQYGLLGEKLSHSFSPLIHKFFYPDPYTLFEVEKENLDAFFKEGAFDGINVTIPYKKAVIPYLGELSSAAQKLQNVNTIIKKADGTLFGDNTDYFGLLKMAEKVNISFKDKKVLVLGSGGAGQTAHFAAKSEGAREVLLVSRKGEVNYENIKEHQDADIIVNATPVGMYPNCGTSPVNLEIFKNLKGVLDLIYNPSKTALILKAEKMGIPYANGLYMLIFQAMRAAEIFSGNSFSSDLADKIAKKIEGETKNILLIGMPGCGKSSVGSALSKMLSKEFIDTDDEIFRLTGKTPAKIIKEEGEDAFRRLETSVFEKVSKESGKIISAGGGIVTREENFPLAKQNSTCIWLLRDLSLLDTTNRPLSEKDGVLKLYQQRKNLYEKFSDLKTECIGIKETAKKIKEMLGL